MYISEKMEKCFEIIKANPNKFVVNEQMNNVQEYLVNNFSCNNVPADVLEFFEFTDGMNIKFVSFYSISKENKLVPMLTFDPYSTINQIENFCSAYGVNKNAFMFFGEDGRQGKFAFLKNVPYSRSIFHFKGEDVYEIREYACFADLLNEILLESL